MIGPEPIATWLPFSWLGMALLVGSLLGAGWAGAALPRFGVPASYIWKVYPFAMVAGVAGAKLWAATETLFSPSGEPAFALVIQRRAGATFYGGLVLGAIAVVSKVLYDRESLLAVSTVFAPTLALSQAIGRIGCFLVGCDYGVPTSLPWGMAFPNAVPPTLLAVHPTQLYESAWLFACAAVLRRRVPTSPLLIAEYLVLQGAGRFAIEFVRTNPRTVGSLTTSQVIALGCVAAGILGLVTAHSRREGR